MDGFITKMEEEKPISNDIGQSDNLQSSNHGPVVHSENKIEQNDTNREEWQQGIYPTCEHRNDDNIERVNVTPIFYNVYPTDNALVHGSIKLEHKDIIEGQKHHNLDESHPKGEQGNVKIQCFVSEEKDDNITEHQVVHAVNRLPNKFDELKSILKFPEQNMYNSADITTESRSDTLVQNNDDTDAGQRNQFPNLAKIRAHVDSAQNKKKSFPCTLCDKSFDRSSKLMTHIDVVHRKLKPYNCTLCEKSFGGKKDLSRHVNTVHYKLTSFTCPICDKSFTRKDNLTEHVNVVHKKLNAFLCSLCGASFDRNSKLKTHIDGVHRKLRPFSCTLCEKSFGRKPDLSKHVNAVHEKLKPFSCTLCDKSFSNKYVLTRHVDGVHNNWQLALEIKKTNQPKNSTSTSVIQQTESQL